VIAGTPPVQAGTRGEAERQELRGDDGRRRREQAAGCCKDEERSDYDEYTEAGDESQAARAGHAPDLLRGRRRGMNRGTRAR
jgi:hypothetical protein